MNQQRLNILLIALLVIIWAGAFVLCYWLVGTSRYVNPPARLGVSFALSGFFLLALCKMMKVTGGSI